MKLLLSTIFLLISFSLLASKGKVKYYKSGCDWIIVETELGFALLEWYGGNIPNEGDILVGKFEEYGMKEIYNLTTDSELKVWVDEFWLEWEEVIEQYYDEC